ncbi:MAG: urease accessory protein, partial [Polaromonas sp.]
ATLLFVLMGSMLQVSKLIAQGQGLAPVLLKRAATVELDWDVRQKSRFDSSDSLGRHLGVFLPRGTLVRGGDVLVAEDGSMVRVLAAPQAVLRITACTSHGSPFDLTRAAYHLGNRHVPIELKPDHLKIEPDHVLADLLRAMHLIVNAVEEAFEPEGGAYSAATHAHSHAITPAPAAAPHVHGPDCQHDHGHGHSHADSHEHAAPATAVTAATAVPIQFHAQRPAKPPAS